jgi:hypothetical protein
MRMHDFIFTKESPQRYYRHVAFWALKYVFQVLYGIFFYVNMSDVQLRDFIVLRFLDIIPQTLFTYTVVYYFVPKYLHYRQRGKFIMATLGLMAVVFAVPLLFVLWSGGVINGTFEEKVLSTWCFAQGFITGGAPVTCGLFLSVGMLKRYYAKMTEKEILSMKNTAAELQLLKAQLHPHFLFNTLNNIYSFTLNNSTQSAPMVAKLSDTLRYMITDCEAPLVPLEKELKMLQDYIGLEKVRYGNRLETEVKISGDFRDKLVPPLLMIPFLENSFKHGASQVLAKPWLRLYASVQDDRFIFRLVNSRPALAGKSNGRSGIGLQNVKKRLQLLFNGNHELHIESGDDFYLVHMELPFRDSRNIRPKEKNNGTPFVAFQTAAHV